MSKSYIKQSGHYGAATDDCVDVHGHACTPYFGQDAALTSSGHAAKEVGPDEAFFSWIIYGGTMDAQGLPVRLIRDVGSGLESDRTRPTNNLSGWSAAAKKIKSINKETGEILNITLQAFQKLSSFFICYATGVQFTFGRANGKMTINQASYHFYTYTPLPPKTEQEKEQEQEPEQQLPPPRG